MAAPPPFPAPADRSEVQALHAGAWTATGPSFAREVRALGAALLGYGLPEGPAAVLGNESEKTLLAELAILVAGGTVMPLDPALSENALRHALATHGVVQTIVSDEVQLARVLALRPDLPALDLLLLSSASPSERRPAALPVDSAIEAGSAELDADPGLLERRGRGEATACLIIDAAGQGLRVPREALGRAAERLAAALAVAEGSSVLTALPLASVERVAAALAVLSHGGTLLLSDTADRADSGLEQRSPDRFLLDPPAFRRLHEGWEQDIAAKPWLQRRLTRWALRQGGTRDDAGWKAQLAERMALRGLRGKLGGNAARIDVLGAPKNADTVVSEAFFASIGLVVRFHDLVPDVPLAR